jgi:hypothetical protein
VCGRAPWSAASSEACTSSLRACAPALPHPRAAGRRSAGERLPNRGQAAYAARRGTGIGHLLRRASARDRPARPCARGHQAVIITHRHKAADAHRRGPPTRPRLLECAADAPARLFGAAPEGARAVPRLALGIREMEVDLVLRGYSDPCHPPSRVALRPLEERQRSAYAIAQALCGISS